MMKACGVGLWWLEKLFLKLFALVLSGRCSN